MRSQLRSTTITATLTLTLLCETASAQDSTQTVAKDSVRAPRGSQLLIPLGSYIVPGLGQYVHRAPTTGLAYTAVAAGGIRTGIVAGKLPDSLLIPRDAERQRGLMGWQVAMSAMQLSSWDAFHRAVPALQREGKYTFLPPRRESVGSLMSAPFDPRFLKRWTTWVDLGQTALLTGVVLAGRESDEPHFPLRGQDVGVGMWLSGNAAVSEEAFFRGYLLPMMYQNFGKRFWLANTAQATLFAAAHGNVGGAPLYIASGLWEGWIVRRNDWSLRESVFHHFWYDVAVVTAALYAEKRPAGMRIRFPAITF